MNFEIGQEYDFYGKIEQINNSTYDTYACNVTSEEGENLVVRIDKETKVSLNKIYYFETEAIVFKEKIHLQARTCRSLSQMAITDDEKERLFQVFYQYAPINLAKVKQGIEERLAAIENPVIKAITEKIYDKFSEDFYLYPAATRYHHAYISGLAYHTYSMIRLAGGFLETYPFLNPDLIYAGIILHDVGKILEFDSFEGSEYTIRGKLVGHITMGAELVSQAAEELGFAECEETMLLEHIVISHHYYGNYGSPKKPNIAEALVIHILDDADSKLCVLGEELDLVDEGDLTSSVGVLDRERYYKHKLTK